MDMIEVIWEEYLGQLLYQLEPGTKKEKKAKERERGERGGERERGK